jgi:hypothetical protein
VSLAPLIFVAIGCAGGARRSAPAKVATEENQQDPCGQKPDAERRDVKVHVDVVAGPDWKRKRHK